MGLFRSTRKKIARKFQFLGIKLPRLKLYQQIIICFVVVVLVPLVVVSVIIYNINQTALRKELTKFTEHTADSIYKELSTEMSWQDEQIKTHGAYVIDHYKQHQDFSKAVQPLFSFSKDVEGVALYNSNGMLFEKRYRHYNRLSPELRLPRKIDITRFKKPTFEVLTTAPSRRVEENSFYLRATVPVILATKASGNPGENLGGAESNAPYAYVIQKRFDFLKHLILENRKTLFDGLYIIDQGGQIIAGPTLQGESGSNKLLNKKELRFFQNLKPGVAREYQPKLQRLPNPALQKLHEEEEMEPLETVFVKIPNIHWGVVIESPYHIRQKYVKRARTQSLLLIAAALIAVFAFSIFYILSISRNFRQLFKGIRAMSDGNYARRIHLITNWITPHEIVLLTVEINRMARKIADGWQQIQELNQELMEKNDHEAFLGQVTKTLLGLSDTPSIAQSTLASVRDYLSPAVVALVVTPPEAVLKRTLLAGGDGLNPKLLPTLGIGQWIEPSPNYSEVMVEQVSSFLDSCLHHRPTTTPSTPVTLQSILPQSSDWLKAFHLGPAWIVPVTLNDEQWGHLVVIQPPEASAFSDETQHLLRLIADQVAVAFNQAYQWETIQYANTQLSKLDELKSTLIDTVSHELRTPLTSIKGYSSRLIRHDEEISPEIRLKSLKTIKQQADRLERLVNDLLVIPELDQAILRVYPDCVLVQDVVERCVQFIQAKEHRDIQKFWNPNTPAAFSVLADPDRFEQILLNLLDNAVKYSHANTPIVLTIEERPAEDHVVFTVANQAEPIADHELPKLFDKFKRIDDQLTRTTRGSGLGLYITKGLVEAMGGRIWLSQEIEGESAFFKVQIALPRYSEDKHLAAAQNSQQQSTVLTDR